MKRFENESTLGNEAAVRRGTRVPDDAVNLAWVKAPKLSPEKNIVMIDTSQIAEENASGEFWERKIMYANHLGVLQDWQGNEMVPDEFPAVADVFSIDEDFLAVPGSEYKDEHILPYLHVSRFYHLDYSGLTFGTTPTTYRTEDVKIIDKNGHNYVDSEGKPKYRIRVVPATGVASHDDDLQAPYRVWAFVDTPDNETLFLTYNKVEINADGNIRNVDINYKEILNPQSYFSYVPEETDVIDVTNRDKKWYSTKPLTLKQQVLGTPHPDVDGYKVYVPKKAISDPRIFQLFRWRVKCKFIQDYKIDPSEHTNMAIRAAAVVTNSAKSDSPYAFYNMENSAYNATKIPFINPKAPTGTSKIERAYWELNFDNATYADLEQFDILLWSVQSSSFNFAPYIAKINHFTQTLGRTLIIETHNKTYPTNIGVTTCCAVDPKSAERASELGSYGFSDGTWIEPVSKANQLWNGLDKLGGWNFNDGTEDEYDSISPFKNGSYGNFDSGYSHYITSKPGDYYTLVKTKNNGGLTADAIIVKDTMGGGHIVFSAISTFQAVSYLFSHTTGALVSTNLGSTVYGGGSSTTWGRYISAFAVEGAYKLFFNICLRAVEDRIAGSSADERRYSTTWTYVSPWKSSWVIRGDVLFDSEKAEHGFSAIAVGGESSERIWQRKLDSRTVEEIINESISIADKAKVGDSPREYSVEVTNPNVQTTSPLGAKSLPFAWTEAPSPAFEIPIELGPNVVRSIDGIKGEYESGQFIYTEYPPKPYAVQVSANFNSTAQMFEEETTTWTATGTATQTTTIDPYYSGDISMYGPIRWSTHGYKSSYISGRSFDKGVKFSNGLRNWQQDNYYRTEWGTGPNNYPYWGASSRLTVGSNGVWVKVVQEIINKLIYMHAVDKGGWLNTSPIIPITGNFDTKTQTAVKAFQTQYNLKKKDGVVDAETWAALGWQIIRLYDRGVLGEIKSTDHTKYYGWALNRLDWRNISDGDVSEVAGGYAKASETVGSPSMIFDAWSIEFDKRYEIHGVRLFPWTEGSEQTVILRGIDVLDKPRGSFNLGGYDGMSAKVKDLNLRLPLNVKDVKFGPFVGNIVLVGLGQDKGTGWGSKMFGVKDIQVFVKDLAVKTPTVIKKTVTITATGTTKVTSGGIYSQWINPQNITNLSSLSDIKWTGVTSSNPKVLATVTATGGLLRLRTQAVDNYSETNFTSGPMFSPTSTAEWYSMNEQGVRHQARETGQITKNDGIKLLCTIDGKPIGFPAMPTEMGANEAARHYTTLKIDRAGNDASVIVGFYDKRRQEFINTPSGVPEMSYIEWLDRGPQNIYIGLISTHQVTSSRPLPVANDAPPIPYKQAQPVYGVSIRRGSQIKLEPLPQNLGPNEVWPVPVRTGKFNRRVSIRSRSKGIITGYLSTYQGQTIHAFYSIPEAEMGGWSTLYGRPNVDIKGEHPLLLDDYTIQVRQAPILMIKEPTAIPSHADPVRPVFKVYTRASASAVWELMSFSNIRDYNVSNGQIEFKTPLKTDNANLIKVDYTTPSQVYSFKQHDGNKLNLNPYISYDHDLIGRAIYIYILPAYVKDHTGKVIEDSIQTRALRFTTDPDIFNPTRAEYNPLAIQLGVVYITTALDINEVTILDSRSRGGGVSQTYNLDEIRRMVSESVGYWDFGPGAGESYPSGGFVIIRLPEELKEQFPNTNDILNTIERNITLGVKFEIEDLQGEAWA